MEAAALPSNQQTGVGLDDPVYAARRAEIADQAAGPDRPPSDIAYTDDEHRTWTVVHAALASAWREHAHPDLIVAWDALDLPADRVPQLREVSERLRPRTGFEYRAVPGLVAKLDFFSGLADGVFLSTQYLRHPATPLYTPEPDVVHEVLGHANCLADRRIAELHRLAGAAIRRVEEGRSRQFIADVFWFSGEFGVIEDRSGRRAYGAGLLSSPGELAAFAASAESRPLDVAAMGTLPYDIDHYQPVLFSGRSLDHVLDEVGGFFDEVDDDLVASISTAIDRRLGPGPR